MDVTCWVMLQLWEPADLRGEVLLLPRLLVSSLVSSFHQPLGTHLTFTRKEITSVSAKPPMSSVAGEQVRGRGRRRRRVSAFPWASCQTGLFRCLGLQHNPSDIFCRKGGTISWRNKVSKALGAISSPSVSRLL